MTGGNVLTRFRLLRRFLQERHKLIPRLRQRRRQRVEFFFKLLDSILVDGFVCHVVSLAWKDGHKP